MRALGNLDLSSEYQTHIFIWLHVFSWPGCPRGILHRELIFLAFLIHISVNGISILLGLLLHEKSWHQCPHPTPSYQALTRDGQLPASAPSPPVPFLDGLIAGLIITCLDCCSSTWLPCFQCFWTFHHSLFLKPFISEIINLILSLCLKNP